MQEQNEFVGHLAELRKRLVYVIVWFFITLCAGLYLSPNILTFIKSQPAAVNIVWNVFSLTDGMFIYMKCAFVFSILFTLPLALYHIWAFVKPGLTEREAKGTLTYVPLSFLLFVMGLSFSYFVVFPMMISFMGKLNQSIGAVETYGIDRYFSFMFNVIFPMGIAFEMPVVILFLTKLGLLTPQRLRQVRKYAYLVLVIVGSCISPPDFVSHIAVTIPLILLFELSIVVSGWQLRKRENAMNS
ncbi:twin-arginine translocase subunit TatC [Paenibacillus xerothermodurans]|uniref:Sec-independent protein translocase protein TatC n=1 Tax=Paenibacillus xerothermodurans TaxID=1977292 RepID=A0A2W1N8V0_PAEXE|nr:twin-arginine translocase subunit TatC [Paenibacillus xerothermodurans]PZE19561.1 twin-arginine translocase subunit TatC [Paenibacillus xerothermodurans]